MRRGRQQWTATLASAIVMLAVAPGRAGIAQAARTLTIAAASDLQAALPGLVTRFERETGARLIVSFGSSGNFFAQIQNGAPYDVFLSADLDYAEPLIARGHADASSLYEYARGRIVLWTRKDSGIDVGEGLRGLMDPRITRIAIANPKHAPYGRAAEAALRHEKVYDAVRGKLVLGESVAQAAQLAESGNASVGIIALSLAIAPALRSRGTYVEIPSAAHRPSAQAAVIISASRHKSLANEFLAFLKRDDVRQQLHRLGFTAPQPGR